MSNGFTIVSRSRLNTATTTIFILKSHQSDIYYPTCSVDKSTHLLDSILPKFFKKYDAQNGHIARMPSGSGFQGILLPYHTRKLTTVPERIDEIFTIPD
jgi:hypothetical protein